MDLGYAIFKGVFQGVTEFLPISSTAHLIFIDAVSRATGWRMEQPLHGEEEFYDLLLHLGTLAAVLVYFRLELKRTLSIWWDRLRKKPRAKQPLMPEDARLNLGSLPLFLFISITLTCVLVLFFLKGSELVMPGIPGLPPGVENLSDLIYYYPQWVAFHLFLTGCLLFGTEVIASKKHTSQKGETVSLKHAWVIGLFQGISALFHGISRSGATISAGLLSGLDRVTATRYSFLLSIPTFFVVAAYELMKMTALGQLTELDWFAMSIGTLFSAITGYFCIKYFLLFVSRHSLKVFAYYCWIVGSCLFLFFSVAGPAPILP